MINIKQKILMVLSFTFISAYAADTEEQQSLPDKRLYIVVNDKRPLASQAQDVNVTARSLGYKVGRKKLAQFPYVDSDGNLYPYISAFPCIIMKSKPNPLEALEKATLEDVYTTSFRSNSGLCSIGAFGLTEKLGSTTKKFSVYKPTAPIINPFKEDLLPRDIGEESVGCIAMIDESLEPGKALNALAHMAVGVGSAYQEVEKITSSNTFASAFDLIGTTSIEKIWSAYNYLRTVQTSKLKYAAFLDTMHLGPTYKEQIAATTLKKTPALKVTGLYAIAPIFLFRELMKALQ